MRLGSGLNGDPRDRWRVLCRAISALGLIVSSLGCGEDVVFIPIEAGDRSALIASEEGGVRSLFAVSFEGEASSAVPFEGDASAMVLLFGESLGDLRLAPGRIPLAPEDGPEARALPEARQVYVLERTGGDPRPATPEELERLREYRIQDPTPLECVERGGCYASELGPGCTVPCPTPSTVAPPSFLGEPDAPRPPVFTPCPSGWRSVSLEIPSALEACEPHPSGAESNCEPFEAWFVGDAACASVAPVCPAGEWPEPEPSEGPLVFVNVNAGPGGDGSRRAPYTSIGLAIAQLPAGGSVVLAAGTYLESVRLPPDVRIVGACPERTIIGAPSSAESVIRAEGGALEKLRLVGGSTSIFVESGATLALFGVILEDAADPTSASVWLEDSARLEGSRVLLRGSAGHGILATGAQVTLDQLVVREVQESAFVADSSTVTLTRFSTAEIGKRSLWTSRSRFRMEQFVFHPGAEPEVYIERGSRGSLSDGLFRSTPEVSGTRFRLSLRSRSEVEGHRLRIESGRRPGVFVLDATAMLSDLELSSTSSSALYSGGGSTSKFERTRINHRGPSSPIVLQEGTAELADVWVHQLAPLPVQSWFPGVEARIGSATVRFQRVRIEGDYLAGIDAEVTDLIEASDLTIDGPRNGVRILENEEATPSPPRGVEFSRVLVMNSAEHGLLIAAPLTAKDLRVDATGKGAVVFSGITENLISLERVEISNANGFGLQLERPSNRVTARDLKVSGTLRRSCDGRVAPDDCLGNGLVVRRGAHLECERFDLQHNEVGVFVAVELVGAQVDVDLRDGLIADNGVGLLVVDPEFPLPRLLERVVLRDNDRSIERGASSE